MAGEAWMIAKRFVVAYAACFAVGCGRSTVGATGETSAWQDAAAPRDAVAPRDAHVDRQVPVDAPGSADLVPCECDDDLVWLRDSCVPSSKLHTCAPPCGPGGSPCAGGEVCDERAATPSCRVLSRRPACVPGEAIYFEPGTLRIRPTVGAVGQPVTLTIEGGSFNVETMAAQIGVHGRSIALGRLPTISLPGYEPSLRCLARATFPPPGAGIFPVLVYQPGELFSLAGFFYARPEPIDTVQPGYPCSLDARCEPSFLCGCAQAEPYSCACVDGRCRCELLP